MQHDAIPESSRGVTNRLLGDLRARRWRPAGWARFAAQATVRSFGQAVTHRQALAEATALHGLFLLAGRVSRWRWVATSWTLTALHLGMLEHRSHLGIANALTLVRGNLPVTGSALGRWLAISAMSSDFVDGKLARHTDSTTSFGRYADPLADCAFWTWLTLTGTGGSNRPLQAWVVLTWLPPIARVTLSSLADGRMVEPSRPRWIRPAVAVQIVIAVRHLQRGRGLETHYGGPIVRLDRPRSTDEQGLSGRASRAARAYRRVRSGSWLQRPSSSAFPELRRPPVLEFGFSHDPGRAAGTPRSR